jgi:hypothetical protein
MRIKSINLATLVLVPFTIWLGYTGRVDWWSIALIWAMEFSVDVKLRR